jgi:hypothetical protein
MIYTLGHTESYLKYYNECKQNNSKFLKLGKKEDYNGKPYSGGYAFKTFESAEKYLKDNNMIEYSVFGLNADWEKDTEHNLDESFNSLLYDSEIIILK